MASRTIILDATDDDDKVKMNTHEYKSSLMVDCVVQYPVTQHHFNGETTVIMPGTRGRVTLSQNHPDSHITSIHTMLPKLIQIGYLQLYLVV